MLLQTFMKHAAKVTAFAPETRPVLKGVLLKSDGSAAVTDSHRLYISKNIHSQKEDSIISTKGEVIPGKYPDVYKLIPTDFRQVVSTEANLLIQYIDCIYGPASLLDEKVLIKFDGHAIHSYMPDVYKAKISIPFAFVEKITLNAKYMMDALKLFKDAGFCDILIGFNGPTRPIVIHDKNNSLLAIIMPVRAY